MTDGLSPETLAAQALGTIDPTRLLAVLWLRDCRLSEKPVSLKRYDFVGRCGLLREHLGVDELPVLGLEIRLGDPTGH
jgi:hypothetical protein